MTEPDPTRCVCPPVRDLIAAYADGDEVPCVVHRPTRRPPVAAIALNNDGALIGRIRNALRADERLRGDPDTAPPA